MKIAIIGGGIAGSTLALFLNNENIEVTLFEKNETLVSGPPFCHLHAGGNLYRELTYEDCTQLLKESTEFTKFYPDCIEYRPTVLATPKIDDMNPNKLLEKLILLRDEYQELVDQDIKNKVFGDPNNYFKAYSKEDILELKNKDICKNPISFDEWMIPFVKNVEIESLQFPVFMVQEYGINMFNLASTVSLRLDSANNVNVLMKTEVRDITKQNNKYIIKYEEKEEKFDFVVNSSGYKTNHIDNMIGFSRDSLIEFKAAYISKMENFDEVWPEIILFGKRGTKNGMAQLTPYANGYFQIHGMNEEITLFKDGLAKNNDTKLPKKLDAKLNSGWESEDIKDRTDSAIKYISKYIPFLKDMNVASKPLFGAQQIPGSNSELRTANVTFKDNSYVVCEIVKASSVIDMSRIIIKQLLDKNIVLDNLKMDKNEISKLASKLTKKRGYPEELAIIVNKNDTL